MEVCDDVRREVEVFREIPSRGYPSHAIYFGEFTVFEDYLSLSEEPVWICSDEVFPFKGWEALYPEKCA